MHNPEFTIPSRALEVWRRLYTRFRLEPFPASVGPDVSKTIIPVTQADALLTSYTRVTGDSATMGAASTNTFDVITVPAGERWTVYFIEVQRLTGDNTFDALLIRSGIQGGVVKISSFAAAASFLADMNKAFVLAGGDAMAVDAAGAGVATTTARMIVWVGVEDAF